MLGDFGQLVVHDVRQLIDVEPARRDIGRDEDPYRAALEVCERARPRALALVAMDRGGAEAVALELLGQTVGAVLRSCEHEHLLPVAGADEPRQHIALLAFVDEVRSLLDLLGRRVAPADLDTDGGMQQLRRERANVVRKRGGEQQALPLARQHRDDAANVGQETHVEHAIGLVEHEDLDVPQVDGALLRMIEEPARRRDDDVDAAPQLVDLRVDADAAVDHGGLQRQVLAVSPDAFADLRRELARRRQDQSPYAASRGRRVLRQALQQRQCESGGLAGARLCAGHDVASFEHDGDDSGLDRSGLRVALFGNGTQQRGLEAQ